MQKSDVRAVENPISAIFDLAADVQEKAPEMKKLVTYSRAFFYIWLFVDFLIIIAASAFPVVIFLLLLAASVSLYSLRWGERRESRIILLALAAAMMFFIAILSLAGLFLVTVFLIILFYLGWVILDLLRDLRKFIDYYNVRHRVIRVVRDADPVVRIPDGNDPISRLLEYMRRSSSETAHVMSLPGTVRTGISLQGMSGTAHTFDAVILAQPSSLWTLTGWAYPGWCILIKRMEGPPRLDDLKYLKHAAEDVTAKMKVPPSRVIAFWTMKEGQSVAEYAYQFVTGQVVTFRRRGDSFRCSLEMIAEATDGSYDLVPFVVQIQR